MNALRRFAAVVAAAAVAPLIVLGGAAPAAAGSGSCSGRLIDTIKHWETTGRQPAREAARTYLYWDGTNNCAKTEKYLERGTPTMMLTRLCRADAFCQEDKGAFSFYAGPVKLPARNSCISLYVEVESSKGYLWTKDRAPNSGFFHCG